MAVIQQDQHRSENVNINGGGNANNTYNQTNSNRFIPQNDELDFESIKEANEMFRNPVAYHRQMQYHHTENNHEPR